MIKMSFKTHSECKKLRTGLSFYIFYELWSTLLWHLMLNITLQRKVKFISILFFTCSRFFYALMSFFMFLGRIFGKWGEWRACFGFFELDSRTVYNIWWKSHLDIFFLHNFKNSMDSFHHSPSKSGAQHHQFTVGLIYLF